MKNRFRKLGYKCFCNKIASQMRATQNLDNFEIELLAVLGILLRICSSSVNSLEKMLIFRLPIIGKKF